MSRHTGYPGGFPFGCWRGMIMEDDHDLDLQIFRNNLNCNWEVSSSYKLQQPPSAALSIPISPTPQQPSLSPAPPISPSPSPSPKSQVPSPGGQEARRPWTPWCPLVPSPAGAAPAGGPEAVDAVVPAGAAPAAWSPLFYAALQGQHAVRCAPQACWPILWQQYSVS